MRNKKEEKREKLSNNNLLEETNMLKVDAERVFVL